MYQSKSQQELTGHFVLLKKRGKEKLNMLLNRKPLVPEAEKVSKEKNTFKDK